MAGGYYGNRYFPERYFPDSYFGTEAESNPNAMRGTFSGAAAFSGALTNGSGSSVVPFEQFRGGGSNEGGGGWASERRRRKRNRQILAILLAA